MKLDADWIVGFTDADGCFAVRTVPTNRCSFVISQDERSKHVLFAIKSFFGVGSVHKAGGTMWAYHVGSLETLNLVIVPFFETHPLRTSKYISWLKFREAVLSNMLRETISRIVSRSLGKSSPVAERHFSEDQNNKNPQNTKNTLIDNTVQDEPITASWLRGFIDGDGCFSVSIVQRPRPQFILGVHAKDKSVCERIQIFLGCGVIYARKNGFVIYQISAQKDLILRLFPILYTHGNCHLLRTQKRHNVSLFRRIVLAMEQRLHLTEQGLAQIKIWKERMRSAKREAEMLDNTSRR